MSDYIFFQTMLWALASGAFLIVEVFRYQRWKRKPNEPPPSLPTYTHAAILTCLAAAVTVVLALNLPPYFGIGLFVYMGMVMVSIYGLQEEYRKAAKTIAEPPPPPTPFVPPTRDSVSAEAQRAIDELKKRR